MIDFRLRREVRCEERKEMGRGREGGYATTQERRLVVKGDDTP